MGPLPSFTGVIIFLCILSALVGWAVIEGFLWIASHISIGWN
jgi:hypothetical protein